jgi:hypothetical protein
LEADPTVVRSLVAERCGADAPVTIVATATGEVRCSADLVGRTGSRRLTVALAPAGSTPAEQEGRPALRWTVEAKELQPGTVVRVTCVSPDLPD